MTKEDYCFSTKKKKSDSYFNDSSNGKYNNFNLNRGCKYSQDCFGETKTSKLNLKNDRYKFSGAFDSFKEEKRKSLFDSDKSWKTSHQLKQKELGSRYSNISNYKNDKKSKTAFDFLDRGFSLSDHIEKNMHLYQIPADDGIFTFKKDKKKFKDASEKVLCPSSDLQASWEFPRQQEDAIPQEPEVMNFTASQKLLHPNQNVESTIRIMLDEDGLLLNNDDDNGDKFIGKEFEGHTKKRFTIQSEIAGGSYGTVYLCEDDVGQKYAMKCVNDEEDFKLEKEILMKATEAKTKHICRLHDFGEANQKFFIVVDLLGSTLEKYFNAEKSDQWSAERKWKVAEQCLIGLQNLHELGYLHLDIKSDNCIMGRGENEHMVYLIDFGVSLKIGDSRNEGMGQIAHVSTAAMELKKFGPKDDLESLLYMVLEMFHGPLPWSFHNSLKEITDMKKALRDDESPIFKRLFGESDLLFEKAFTEEQLTSWYTKNKLLKQHQLFPELVKMMRYIDALKAEEVPNYNKILYFLRSAFTKQHQKGRIAYEKKMIHTAMADEKIQLQQKFAAKEKELEALSKHCRSEIEESQDVAYFIGYKVADNHKNVLNPRGKFYSIEYNGYNFVYVGETEEGIFLKNEFCGKRIFVYYDGSQQIGDVAQIKTIKDLRHSSKKKTMDGKEN